MQRSPREVLNAMGGSPPKGREKQSKRRSKKKGEVVVRRAPKGCHVRKAEKKW